MKASASPNPHVKNVTTVLDIIDKSLNSLRSPSVVQRAAGAKASPRAARSNITFENSLRNRRDANNSRVPLGTPGRTTLATYDSGESKGDGDAYLNTLTTELLKQQNKCSALEAENENLKRKVSILAKRGAKSRDYSGKNGSSPRRPEFRGLKTTYRPKFTKYSEQLGDISSIVGKLHDCIAIESQEIATRNVETECVVGLEAMRNVIDLGAEGVRHLQDDEMARTDWLQKQAEMQANSQERNKTLDFEVHELKESERRLKEELVAFEAENMRLANELQDERHKNTENGRFNGINTEQTLLLQSKINTLTAEKDQLLLNCQQAESRITRFINEIDELKNVQSDLLNTIKILKEKQG